MARLKQQAKEIAAALERRAKKDEGSLPPIGGSSLPPSNGSVRRSDSTKALSEPAPSAGGAGLPRIRARKKVDRRPPPLATLQAYGRVGRSRVGAPPRSKAEPWTRSLLEEAEQVELAAAMGGYGGSVMS